MKNNTEKKYSWIKKRAQNYVLLACHIQPGAQKSQFKGIYDEKLKIAINASPEKGTVYNNYSINFLQSFFTFNLFKRGLCKPCKDLKCKRGNCMKMVSPEMVVDSYYDLIKSLS